MVLFVIVMMFQVNTDVESYHNVEDPPDEDEAAWKPLNPFLLWLTTDKVVGELYLKIDSFSFHLGSQELNTPTSGILRAFDIMYKAHYVFNLDFHPYLTEFYNCIDALYKLRVSQSTSVKSLVALISKKR